MNWKPISEKPKKDGWYLWWDGHCYSDLYYIVGKSSGHHYTHWLEIAGPEDCCTWTYDDFHSYYERTCLPEDPFGISNYEGLPENNIHHCPNCGREIKEVKQ